MSLFQPVTQVRLTNVATVRLKKKGKRFEIACYKNKVVNWRNGVETDIGEVLQAQMVFANVSKGIAAKKKDMQTCFNTSDFEMVAQIILEKGELQVSDKEREVQIESLFRDIAQIISTKCVNPENGRPYPVSLIERSLHEVKFNPVTSKSAKQQALSAVRMLQEIMTIERAPMSLKITVPDGSKDMAKEFAISIEATITKISSNDGICSLMLLIPPHQFRPVDKFCRDMKESRGIGSLEVIELAVQKEAEHSIEEELQRLQMTTSSIPTASSIPVSKPTSVPQKTSTVATPSFKCNTCKIPFETKDVRIVIFVFGIFICDNKLFVFFFSGTSCTFPL
eukprot:TRINITY_DN128879_c0_g1_i1.p1 TRINITY_DN128879_c0_g1~~TRINITY_DN128879_c0_g1_i1.p1  ORF type:complete len:337 (-),score=75.72 TRINITY_DN128879_c0_g1_i1:288-1298(-)